MYCKNCRGQNPDTANFCYYCGINLRDTLKDTPHKKIEKKTTGTSLLPELLQTNAYHILGLDTSSEPQTIRKRGNEIINRLKIDDLPNYDLDIETPNNFRNEETTKKALQKLISPKQSLHELYFWFDLSILSDKRQLIDAINHRDHKTVVKLLRPIAKDSSHLEFIQKKNLAIYSAIFLFNGLFKKDLPKSLVLWNKLINSEKNWMFFIDIVKKQFGLDIEPEVIADFKKCVIASLSDLYTEISQKNNDPEYLSEFQKIFSTTGGRLEKDILIPIFEKIYHCIEELNKITPIKDIPNDEIIIKNISSEISQIQDHINKLTSYGLNDDSQVIAIRDQAAKTIRSLSIKINNDWNNQTIALGLIQTAREISGTTSFGVVLEEDKTQLEELINVNIFFNPIDELIKNKQFSEALLRIKIQEESDLNKNFLDVLIDRKKFCIHELVIEKYNNAMKSIKERDYSKSKPFFKEIIPLIYDNLLLFNINKKTLDELLNEIPMRINSALQSGNVQNLNLFREDIIKLAKENFEGRYEEDILIVMVDSNVYPILIDKGFFFSDDVQPISTTPTLYTLNGIGAALYGDTQYFVVIFIPIVPIARFSVEQIDSKSYRFFGKLELHPWQKLWQYLFVAIVGYFIVGYWIISLLIIWFILLFVRDKKVL